MRKLMIAVLSALWPFLTDAALATESSSNIAILGLDETQQDQMAICNGTTPQEPEQVIKVCSKLMDDPYFANRRIERSALYLYRSTAFLKVGKFDAAIADSDQAAKLFPKNGNNENQRCWARAYANVQLDEALKACLKAIEFGSASARRLDSLGLLRLRKGDWMAAVSEYDFAGRWIEDSIYGRILAEYGFRAHQTDEGYREQILKERIAPLESKLGAEGMATAIAKFAAMGITRESVERQAVTAKE